MLHIKNLSAGQIVQRVGIMSVGLLVVGSVAYFGTHQRQSSQAASICTVNSILVNSCRPWLGSRAGSYPLPAGTADTVKNQMLAHEQRIGRQVEIAHVYHTPGQAVNSDDSYFINRPSTYLFMDWKPAGDWSTGSDTTNATTNASIDKMGNSIKALGTKKIFLTVWHEPQNDVTAGTYPCTASSGSKGSPAQYRAMWQNVRNRFNSLGISNVVWVVDYQSYEPLDCVIDDLYPGNNLVDWVVTNGYGNSNQANYTTNVQHYYDFFTNHSNTSHNYTSKPWGIIEWNIQGVSGTVGATYYDQAKAALDNNTFPRLKMNVVFDSIGPDIPVKDYRVQYDNTGLTSALKQSHYNAFAQDARFTDSFYGSSTDNPPTVSLTAPVAGNVSTTSVSLAATATDDHAVANVGFSYKLHTVTAWSLIGTLDTTSPYAVTWNTATLTPGAQYDVRAIATDSIGQTSTASIVTVTIANVAPGNGDANGDGRVNAIDLSILISHDCGGSTVSGCSNYLPADFDHNGSIGAGDMAIVLSKWNW